MALRLATIADLPAVQAVVRRAYSPYVARIGREPGPMSDDYRAHIEAGRVHVAERDGALLGLLVLIREPTTMLLDNLAVDPDAQGLGLGRMMLDYAEEAARAAGLRAIRLYTNQAMTENIGIYSRRGYAETHRAEVNGLKRVYMSKSLRSARDESASA